MTATDRHGDDRLPKQRRSRALLAVLALSAPHPVPRALLTNLLWSRRDPAQARASLRQCVHEVKDAFGGLPASLLRADRASLALDLDVVWVDALEVAASDGHRPDGLALLSTGPLLHGFAGLDGAFDQWIATARAGLARGAVAAASSALRLCAAGAAHPAAVIAAAERLVALDPTNEGARRILAAALEAGGAGMVPHATRPSPIAPDAPAADVGGEQAGAVQAETMQAETMQAGAMEVARRAPRGVCLGVMPFRLLDGPSNEGLSVGLAEDITAALSRFRWFVLIASPSLAAVKAAPAHEQAALLQGLGLDFLLDGTIQRAGGRVRVIVRLLDMRGHHAGGPEIAWSRRFDGSDRDLLTLQDRVAAETVAQVDPELLLREGRLAAGRPARDLTAFELTLRAMPAIHSLDEPSFRGAGGLLQAAIARDPDYAAAHAWAAYWEIFLCGQGWADDADASMRNAGALARRAIALDPGDARALTIAGHVHAFVEHRADAAHAFHEQALQLNPNLPLAWAFSGLALTYDGDHARAIHHTTEARRLSPFDPHRFLFDGCEMVPNLALGNDGRVVELARRAIALNPKFSSNFKVHLAALGHLGADAEAGEVRARLLALEPGFCIRMAEARSPMRRAADRDRYLDGLRRAGLPE